MTGGFGRTKASVTSISLTSNSALDPLGPLADPTGPAIAQNRPESAKMSHLFKSLGLFCLLAQLACSARVGLAPQDRPSCQLPTLAGQRRHQQQLQQQHQLQPLQPLQPQPASQLHPLAAQADDRPTREDGNASEHLQASRPSLLAPTVLSIQQQQQQQSGQLPNSLQARRADSSERLRQLRQLLASNAYDGYLVGPNDEHNSEYVADSDRRLRFLTSFEGSNGLALVLLDRAVLFTDGRYALQADKQLDCNWWLVVGDDPLADLALWLRANAPRGLKVAADARLMSLQSYDYLEEQLRKLEGELALISQDLVDVVWSESSAAGERRASQEPLFVHPLAFAGNVSWQEKVARVAGEMGKLRARHYVISQLDDVAWLLNLRGSDIPMSPLFKAYALLSRTELPAGSAQASSSASPGSPSGQTRANSLEQLLLAAAGQGAQTLHSPQVLQVPASQLVRLTLYVDLRKLTDQVRAHLQLENSTASSTAALLFAGDAHTPATRIQLELKDYELFIMDFREKLNGRQLAGRLLLSAGANVAIHVLAKQHDDRLVLMDSLVNKLKSVKTDAEVQGMRLAHWRDSLAICMLLSQLELDVGSRTAGNANRWTEMSAAKELELYRSLMDFNRGQSFESISAYASNAAIVHYKPQEDPSTGESRAIGNQSTYLLDSGGQYLDGTTDITRTLHFGEPTEFQRETYTRVLMGAIDMMSLVFEQSTRSPFRLNDLISRRHLLDMGLDYAHGTGHGIGLFSLVHEAPWLLEHYTGAGGQRSRPKAAGQGQQAAAVLSEPVALQANMFTSVEPGYYQPGEFGIRLENIVVTQRVEGPAGAGERQLLRLEPISLVPFEPKLIRAELLSNKQKSWLNSYNLLVRLRLTQQINHYLAKLRSAAARGSPANRTAEQLPRNDGQLNYLRMDGRVLQEKLEQTHRWILAKTELLALDVPQRLAPVDAKPTSKSAEVASSDQRPSGANRLVLAYMSSLPFNDLEAGEAVQTLAARADSLDQSASKCTGLECDLWLVEALNRPGRATSRQPVGSGSSAVADSAPLSSLFQLAEPARSQVSMSVWSLLALSLLAVGQLAVVVLACRRSLCNSRSARQTVSLAGRARTPTGFSPASERLEFREANTAQS